VSCSRAASMAPPGRIPETWPLAIAAGSANSPYTVTSAASAGKMPAARARIRCSDTLEYTRSRMSFQPRGGISEGVVASRPRPSSSVVAREPADKDTPDRSPPPGRRYSIAAAAASRATAGKRARPSEREASVSARLLRNIDFTDRAEGVQAKRDRIGVQERSCYLETYFVRLQGVRDWNDAAWWMRERALTDDDVRHPAENENISLGIPADALLPILQIAARIGSVLMRLAAVRVGRCFRRPLESR
jgi:hypothetical protein